MHHCNVALVLKWLFPARSTVWGFASGCCLIWPAPVCPCRLQAGGPCAGARRRLTAVGHGPWDHCWPGRLAEQLVMVELGQVRSPPALPCLSVVLLAVRWRTRFYNFFWAAFLVDYVPVNTLALRAGGATRFHCVLWR